MSLAPVNTQTQFLPTTTVFPREFDEFNIRMTTIYTQMAQNINNKESGLFEATELLNGQQWFQVPGTQQSVGQSEVRRQAFRQVYSIGAISAGATSTTAHGITGVTSFTNIQGTCVTSQPDYRPLPYVSTVALNQQISLTVDATNITIINGAASPNITSAIVVLEYLKN